MVVVVVMMMMMVVPVMVVMAVMMMVLVLVAVPVMVVVVVVVVMVLMMVAMAVAAMVVVAMVVPTCHFTNTNLDSISSVHGSVNPSQVVTSAGVFTARHGGFYGVTLERHPRLRIIWHITET